MSDYDFLLFMMFVFGIAMILIFVAWIITKITNRKKKDKRKNNG